MPAIAYKVGNQKRSKDYTKAIGIACILALGAGYFYDASGPSVTERGTITEVFYATTKPRGHKVKVLIDQGPHTGEIIRLPRGMNTQLKEGDRVEVDITVGKATGLLHSDNIRLRSKP